MFKPSLLAVIFGSAISRLVLRKDGFISASADYKGGRLISRPIEISGNELILNLDTGAAGMIKLGMLDETNRPIPGFSEDECIIIHTCNDTEKTVVWTEGADLTKLMGRKVKISMEVLDIDIYSFCFRR